MQPQFEIEPLKLNNLTSYVNYLSIMKEAGEFRGFGKRKRMKQFGYLPADGATIIIHWVTSMSILGAAGGVARFPKGYRDLLMLILTFYVIIVLSNSDRVLAIYVSL